MSTPLLALIFSSGAVLQRRLSIPAWGFAPAGTIVDAAFAGSTLRAAADASGRWAVSFPAQEAGGPYLLTANASNGLQQTVNDVLVGEVVLCGGCVWRAPPPRAPKTRTQPETRNAANRAGKVTWTCQ